MGSRSERPAGFDGAAAVTRSLLGYGVVAGGFYLVVGLLLAVTRDGFALSRHPLSLLMLGDGGWMQRTNIIVVGFMTIAAAMGFARAMRGSVAARRSGFLLTAYGVGLVLSGVFPPDPMAGFPPGAANGDPSMSGLLHLAAGGLGFLCLAGAALVVAGWFADRGPRRGADYSRGAAIVVFVGFVGGAALATRVAGVALLWLAVVVGWAWLAGASLTLYRAVPHPDADRRTASPA